MFKLEPIPKMTLYCIKKELNREVIKTLVPLISASTNELSQQLLV